MADTTKKQSERDYQQTLKLSFNDSDASLTTSSFITAKLGHKITRSVISSTVDNYSYYDGTTLLYTIKVTYNNSAHDEVNEVERIA